MSISVKVRVEKINKCRSQEEEGNGKMKYPQVYHLKKKTHSTTRVKYVFASKNFLNLQSCSLTIFDKISDKAKRNTGEKARKCYRIESHTVT